MKTIKLMLMKDDSRFLLQNLHLILLVMSLAVLSPFCGWSSLHYDLFGSGAFFLFYNQFPRAIIWTSFASVYLDTVLALPLGSHCAFLFVLWGLVQVAQSTIHRKSIYTHWGVFCISFIIATNLKLWLAEPSLYLWPNILSQWTSIGLTICCYPLLCYILAHCFDRYNYFLR